MRWQILISGLAEWKLTLWKANGKSQLLRTGCKRCVSNDSGIIFLSRESPSSMFDLIWLTAQCVSYRYGSGLFESRISDSRYIYLWLDSLYCTVANGLGITRPSHELPKYIGSGLSMTLAVENDGAILRGT